MYRPPQWKSVTPQKVIITFPGQGQPAQYGTAVGSNVTLPTGKTLYAFDAEIEIEHQQRLTRTKHPVQTGGSITDHAYIEPATVVLDIGMSDAMDAYFSPSTWVGAQSKSVAAYQTMLALQFSRIPLQITTRLRTYQNMVVDDLSPVESYKTFAGLRARITFGEIFLADITQTADSARPQETGVTQLGSVDVNPPSAAQQQQNNVLDIPEIDSMNYNVIGAGNWSSVSIQNLSALPGPK